MIRPPSVRQSFFLHLHPDRVHPRTLAPATTLGLGALAFLLLAVLLLTGVVLMFWYVPAPGTAYDRVVDLSAGALPFGGLMRDLHRLSSDALVVVVVLHLVRVYLTGALGPKRQLNWLVGLSLLLLVLATAFTGYLLPWDRDAYWAATVGGELVALLPGLGPLLRDALWGGDAVNADTVVRAYAWHVAALPLTGSLLLGYHFWRIRKAGGLARPQTNQGEPTAEAETLIPTRPALTVRELILALCSVTVLLLVALVWDAPLGLPGFPPEPLDPPKAPWFFLWIQELVSYNTTLGGTIPLLVLAALAAAPLLEMKTTTGGLWFAKERRRRCLAFLLVVGAIVTLIVIADSFRGPGWRLL